MEPDARITANHDEIRAWAEQHHARPQIIDEGQSVGLRLDFPGVSDEEYDISNQIHDATWSRFFEILDAQDLAIEFVEPEHRDDHEHHSDISNLYRFIKRPRSKTLR